MRLTREESREQTRERLIEAARLSVARNGYDATSIGDIAENAGFTKGAFFSNFENKEALLLELLRRHKTEEIETLNRLMTEAQAHSDGTDTSALEAYINGLEAQRDWYLLDVELKLHAGRTPVFAVQYTDMQSNCNRALGTMIAELFGRAGKVIQTAPEDVAAMFLALISGLILTTGANPARPPFGAMVKLVLQSLLEAAPHTSTSAS